MTKPTSKADSANAPSIYDQYENDDELEIGGIWLNYGKAGRIRVARAGGSNHVFKKALEKATRPHRRQINAGNAAEDLMNELLVQVFAQCIILDWENIRGRDKVLMPFSKENVVKLFTDLPDLFIDVREAAMQAANFQRANDEDDSKN